MYRCAAGGEMKPLTAFTASQQRRANGYDRQNSGMVCKEHSQPAGLERYCHVCTRTLPIHKFSRNSRNDDEPRCIQCTAWDADAEPSITPIPLATGHVSVEENVVHKWKEPTNTADFFEKEDLPMAPITGPEGLDLPASESVNKLFTQVVGKSSSVRTMPTASETSSTAGEHMSTTSSSRVPPHLKALMPLMPRLGALTVDDQSVSAKSNEQQTNAIMSQLPRHLTNLKKPLQESGGSGSITGSISTATTLRNEKKEVTTSRQITFNSWDSDGRKHRAIKSPTVMSSSTSAASASATGETENGSNIVGDWGGIPPAPEPQVRKGGKWPKSSELRISQAELKERERQQDERQKFNPDDDDQRRRKNFK
ncbi:hypothetical protein ACHAPA_003874 [Fusarium lateritium]